MSKILLLSNGHGEDLSGSLLAKYLVERGDLVEALPIVGDGKNYKGKYKNTKTKNLVQVVLVTILLKEEWLKYLGDKFFTFWKNYICHLNCKRFLFSNWRYSSNFFAWFSKKDFFFLVAYSSHYEGKLKLPGPVNFFNFYAKNICPGF